MEKFSYKSSTMFYPSIGDFLNESNLATGRLPKIPVSGTVKAADGTLINMAELEKEMESAKIAIVSQSPLFAPYVHEFTPIYTWIIPTMATDGLRLFVNPKFANNLTWEQKIFVIIHEIMHCVLMHMERGKGKEPKVFNIAADLEINPLIIDTIDFFKKGFVEELGGLYDEKYLNEPVEKIYNEIMKDIPKMPPLPNNQ